MAPLLSLVGLLKWPLTVSAAVVVFATATGASLSLLRNGFAAGVPTQSTIKAGMSAPIIRMPDTPVVSPEAARVRVSLIFAGQRYAIAGAGRPKPAADETNPARMVASTGLVVRSQPRKASANVGSIASGTTVGVHSKQGGWLLVDGPGGVTGWVFGKYLMPASGG